ncbi:hypothetical protein BN2475_150168 [Paraburkholderia ribeironis]|uniref:Uncharacterized protein n=1 Tax=Paraburkholderia ribeironis TaxID=1247936 RepID=A0A1N7RTZ8_9BURK|nr:hypothetical protein BN2475_150168 [Paraburkholderia ribeironis]
MSQFECMNAARADVEYQSLNRLDFPRFPFNVAARYGRDLFTPRVTAIEQKNHGAGAPHKELLHRYFYQFQRRIFQVGVHHSMSI